ncbi:hypothetical protein [Methylotenera sp. G11]|uniref:hypothetical protein n=1 Tax=Methylotenera sp. G11 TaxID=1506585 RepID=UPI0006466A26|nr:hypothetical protein [Methylotenera sp. G11]
MNQSDQELAHRIKLKFGTPPQSPTELELSNIKGELSALVDRGVVPSEHDWFYIISKYCPDTGRYSYHGLDNSDLVMLLQLATDKK